MTFITKATITAFLAALLLQLTSCGHSGPIQQIPLPDSTLVGQVVPTIDGTLAEYYTIVPNQYELDVTDSIASLNITVRLDKNFTPDPDDFKLIKILNGDTALISYPYVVLTTKKGKVIPNFHMELDKGLLSQLEATIIGDVGETVGLHFVSPMSIDEDMKEDLADDAYSFKLVAGTALVNEEMTIRNDTIDTHYLKQ